MTDRNGSQDIYETIKMEIVKQQLEPGQRLPERELANRFAVSRTPIRQVLQQLAAEGFVEFTPYRGAVVRALTPEDLKDLFEVRMALEGIATQLFANWPSPEVMEALQENLQQAALAIEKKDIGRFTLLDQQFHSLIVAGTGNKELENLVQQLNQKTYAFRLAFLTLPGQIEVSRSEHQAILKCIEAAKAQQARELAEEHALGAIERFSYFFQMKNAFMNIS